MVHYIINITTSYQSEIHQSETTIPPYACCFNKKTQGYTNYSCTHLSQHEEGQHDSQHQQVGSSFEILVVSFEGYGTMALLLGRQCELQLL